MNFSLETKDREVEEQQQPEKQEPVIIQSHSTDSEDEETIREFSARVKVRKNNCKFSINTWSNWRYI